MNRCCVALVNSDCTEAIVCNHRGPNNLFSFQIISNPSSLRVYSAKEFCDIKPTYIKQLNPAIWTIGFRFGYIKTNTNVNVVEVSHVKLVNEVISEVPFVFTSFSTTDESEFPSRRSNTYLERR